MRALITGITGFVGSHLTELLLDRGFEVYGTLRWRSPMDNISHLLGRIELVECDLRDASSVKEASGTVSRSTSSTSPHRASSLPPGARLRRRCPRT